LRVEDFAEIGQVVAAALTPEFDSRKDELGERVQTIVERYPLYEHLNAVAAA